ncbi:DUF1800 domain-containing protein [Ruegeria arenilitoris]|uniref:DUF1800 domain-containing protein n=1 Tax=Ruegeria arenilitoris TaxID=1173585 RepID=UPI00147FB9C6|nr:DUF1800 family protein [Ruegeria arenilitoris]
MSQNARVSRFLMQATLGADQALVDQVKAKGMEPWLMEQLKSAPIANNVYETRTREIWQSFRQRMVAKHGAAALNGEGNNPALPYKWYFHMAWWQHLLSQRQDMLRQRVALALSELLVISDNSSLELDAVGMASYYDVLYRHAFGSYADMLYEVSMHPTMGIYLSHMNNQKAVPEKYIHPDENYAREIMQLFSIGLFELNPDGSEKLDSAGNPIPTYDNSDIREMARVFTGLTAAGYRYEWTTSFWQEDYNGYPVGFDDGIEKSYKTVPFVSMTQPMVFHKDYHDRGPKKLLNGHIDLPGGQSGEEEVWEVVQRLVTHPSTAPFVARHMIARLVTSNPSPDYVRTVSEAFGPNGDMASMVYAILAYPLAAPVSDTVLPGGRQDGDLYVQSQKLKSPLQRITQLMLAFNARNESGKYWLLGDDIQDALAQHPLSAPTVFNFYKADFVPHGGLEDKGLVAPEFELHTSSTSIAWINQMYQWFFGEWLPIVSTQIGASEEGKMVPEMWPEALEKETQDHLKLDLDEAIEIAKDPGQHDVLIDQLSELLTGRPELAIKPQIKEAFRLYANEPAWVVQTILFMITISPEFTVQEA